MKKVCSGPSVSFSGTGSSVSTEALILDYKGNRRVDAFFN